MEKISKALVEQIAHQYKEDIIAYRNHLHQNPELSYQEYKTSAFIQEQLKRWGVSFQVLAQTGVVAVIEGKNPQKRTIALRADIDALPIQEENEVDYKSTVDGVMHACGHDVHTACLLGATRILLDTKAQWEGTIKLIFQLGEEKNPGGASLMIAEGVLENPAPKKIIALHVDPDVPVGKVSFNTGKIMASADELYFTIKGKGGHAGLPHQTQDVILIASHLIVNLQQLISRNCSPFIPSVLSICSFQGGNSTNVIPAEVQLKGTFRAMDETWRYKAHELIRQYATSWVTSMGASLDMHISIGYPSVINDEALTLHCATLAKDFLGVEQVLKTPYRMAAEDFGFYTQKIPGCFFRLGVRNEAKGIVHSVHTPQFNIDEQALVIGASLMAYLAIMVE